jgi:hypothetical protein
MEEEIIDVDDYANWLRWVSDAKQSRHAMYESTHYATILLLLQVHQAEGCNLDSNSTEQLASFNHDELSTRWKEICQESRLALAWIKRSNNNSGRFWNVTNMFLLGTKVN